ncbi:MAG: SusC/RagA family TonB-linked outer membrane protein, partial [Bacteroidales bacterium]
VSSINNITTKELAISPSRNLTNNLAGKVSGLIAVQRSGEPGYDNSDFWIRGVSSFKGGTNPLILVDGVPRSMSDIEVDEIETFTLLKDAAATAVYGAEGANGVILITSKRGMDEKPRITFRGELTSLKPTRLPKFMNSAETLRMFNEALNNEGKEGIYSDELIEMYESGIDPDLYPNTDWLGGMLRDNTFNMRYTLNVRGGAKRAKYFVSGAYFKENGIFESNQMTNYDTNIGLERYNLRSNVDFEASPTTNIGVDISGQYLKTNYPGVGSNTIFTSMCLTPPHMFPMQYSDGTIAGHPRPSSTRVNPYNQLMHSGYTQEWRTNIQSKVQLDQDLKFITNGLSFKAALSFDANLQYVSRRTKTPTQYIATGRDEDGKIIYKKIIEGSETLADDNSSSSNKQIYFETSLNYKRTFAEKHDVTGLLLYMHKDKQDQGSYLPFRKQGFIGRFSYGFDDRYFVEGSFGYTGSETFAKGNRFGFFPAAGLSWYLSNENFYSSSNINNIMNKFKIRASVGRTGNDNTGGARFMYRGTMKSNASGYDLGYNNNGSMGGIGNGIIENLFESPYLTWEIEVKQNYGLDLGFFNNKVDLQVDYFKNRRHNILLQRATVSNVTGFHQMPWQNFGIVENQGMDASININHRVGEVNLSARGNFTFARNKIVEYDQADQNYPWLEMKGARLNSWKLYVADGLYTHDDFIIKGDGLDKTYELKPGVVSGLSSGLRPGDIKYKDLNGDGKIDSNDQMVDVGHPSIPEIVYGFGFNAEWKGLYAGIFFQGAGNTSTVLGANTGHAFFPFVRGIEESAVRDVVANRWTEANPSQDVMFPRLHSGAFPNNTAASTWWQRDASFIRLKNVEVGYTFNPKTLSKMRLKGLRVYLLGNNLFVWDKIKMWDPELGNGNGGFAYPLNRTFTFGLDFTI